MRNVSESLVEFQGVFEAAAPGIYAIQAHVPNIPNAPGFTLQLAGAPPKGVGPGVSMLAGSVEQYCYQVHMAAGDVLQHRGGAMAFSAVRLGDELSD